MTVRDIDGNLRNAPWDVKERMNQIYNPREGRKVVTPAMFKEANLEVGPDTIRLRNYFNISVS